jgi:citrate lyase subunit beta / citryl-CoA lyase
VFARSFLYAPGDRPDRLEKALSRAGDAVIADLEDAVVPAHKDRAREEVAALLATVLPGRAPAVWVRVNSGARGVDDLAALGGSPGLSGVVLPKADRATVAAARSALPDDVALAALLETARGLLEAPDLARAGVSHLGLGEADLAADLGLSPSPDARELWPLRMQVVVASAAAGIAPPTGPVHLDVRDLDGLRHSTQGLRRAGFGSRSAVHPGQVAVIEEVFTPTGAEVDAARAVVASYEASLASGAGVVVDERGRMVDEAVVRSSRRVVETAERLGL